MSSPRIAKRLRIDTATVSRLAKSRNIKIRKEGYHKWKYPLSKIKQELSLSNPCGNNKRFINPIQTKSYDQYLRLNFNDFIVACDFHAPFVHEEMLNILLDFGYRYKVPDLLIPGDFFDEIQFSDFDTSSEDMINLDEEVESSKAIYKSLQGVFKNIYFTTGNHDVRFWKRLIRAGKVNDKTWKTMWNLVDGGMNVSPYRYCEVNDYWRITHPKYAVRIGSLGGMPGIRYRAKLDRSMIFAHGHWWGMVQDPSGKYYMILPGCMVDQSKIAYSNVWDTPYENWHNGFLFVENGNIPHLIDEKIAKGKIWACKL